MWIVFLPPQPKRVLERSELGLPWGHTQGSCSMVLLAAIGVRALPVLLCRADRAGSWEGATHNSGLPKMPPRASQCWDGGHVLFMQVRRSWRGLQVRLRF